MNKIFNDFLEKVEKYLNPLPISERMDIIQEIKSQISELETAGKSPEEILERLGNPKDLAKAYLSSLITNQRLRGVIKSQQFALITRLQVLLGLLLFQFY